MDILLQFCNQAALILILAVTSHLAETFQWLPPQELVKSRTALATINFLMLLLAKLLSATFASDFEYGTAVFRVSDINLSNSDSRQVSLRVLFRRGVPV